MKIKELWRNAKESLFTSSIDPLSEEALRNYLSTYTKEPLEVINERINKRLFAKAEVRAVLVTAYREVYAQAQQNSHLALYRAQVNLGSLLLFGEHYQQIRVGQSIEIGEKDTELLERFSDIPVLYNQQNPEGVFKTVQNLITVTGTQADRGEYDGYNHEVLLGYGIVADSLRRIINSPAASEQLMNIHQRRSGVESAIYQFNDGIVSSDRLKIIESIAYLAQLNVKPPSLQR